MNTSRAFTPEEEQRLVETLRRGDRAACPRCGVSLDEWPIPPRSDVSYVRERVWLVCPACHRKVVLERRDLR